MELVALLKGRTVLVLGLAKVARSVAAPPTHVAIVTHGWHVPSVTHDWHVPSITHAGDQAARWMGGKMRRRWEDSTVVLTINKRVENGPGSNKPVAPISRLLFSPREEPLVEGTIRRVGIQKAAGIQNADDVWVGRRCRCRLPVSRRAHSKDPADKHRSAAHTEQRFIMAHREF